MSDSSTTSGQALAPITPETCQQDWSGAVCHVLGSLTHNQIVIFPYFYAAIALWALLAIRKEPIFEREGLPIFAVAFLLPILLFAWNKGLVGHEAGVAILSSASGYIFGRKGADDSRSKQNDSASGSPVPPIGAGPQRPPVGSN
jgi:hypothetical protein